MKKRIVHKTIFKHGVSKSQRNILPGAWERVEITSCFNISINFFNSCIFVKLAAKFF